MASPTLPCRADSALSGPAPGLNSGGGALAAPGDAWTRPAFSASGDFPEVPGGK